MRARLSLPMAVALALLVCAVSMAYAQPPSPSAPQSSSTDAPGASADTPASEVPPSPEGAASPAADGQDAQPEAANAKQLPGVTVEGKRDAFSKSDQHLKELIGGLPCTGCDTKTEAIKEKHGLGEKAVKYVAGKVLPTAAPNDSDARANDPDAVRNATAEAARRPLIQSSPNNNP